MLSILFIFVAKALDMKKIPSNTIKYNRGVGDQRVRNLESCMEKVVSAVNEMGDLSPVVFCEQLPQTPDPDVIYAIVEE